MCLVEIAGLLTIQKASRFSQRIISIIHNLFQAQHVVVIPRMQNIIVCVEWNIDNVYV